VKYQFFVLFILSWAKKRKRRKSRDSWDDINKNRSNYWTNIWIRFE